MSLAKYRGHNYVVRKVIVFFIIILLTNILFLDVSAKHKEFDVEEFQENLTITGNNYVTIDFNFDEGKSLEIIYIIQVTNEKPISIWFVNEDNFLLSKSGSQFLHFMDGSGQDISYAKRAVTLTKHDNYKLVLINYNNETAEANIVGEIRKLIDSSDDDSTEFISILIYIFIVTIIILVCLLTLFGFKIRKYRNSKNNDPGKKIGKKEKKKKGNKNKKKNNKKSKTKPESKKEQITRINKTKKENKSKAPTNFCGYCGEAVETPFCKNCGKKN